MTGTTSPVAPASAESAAGGEVAFANLLIATDFSKPSYRALHYGLGIARRFGSRVWLAHVLEPAAISLAGAGALEKAEELAWRQARRLETDLIVNGSLARIPAQVVVRRGEIWPELARLVTAHNIDLLVVGTHGRTGFRKLMLGSVAERIFRQASCPVLTVGPRSASGKAASDAPRRILFPTDFSPASRQALRYAVSLARKHQAALLLLHVLPELHGEAASDRDRVQRGVETMLNEMAAPAPDLAPKLQLLVETGAPVEGILGAARAQGAGLIVMGVRAQASFMDRVGSPNAYRIVSEAPCPVLSIRFEPCG